VKAPYGMPYGIAPPKGLKTW